MTELSYKQILRYHEVFTVFLKERKVNALGLLVLKGRKLNSSSGMNSEIGQRLSQKTKTTKQKKQSLSPHHQKTFFLYWASFRERC